MKKIKKGTGQAKGADDITLEGWRAERREMEAEMAADNAQLKAAMEEALARDDLPPEMKAERERQILTRREIEVMGLIVQGYINKEVADKLHIGLSTVVTHRKNIMEKLGLKSLSALTIYAVTHGYVDVNKV